MTYQVLARKWRPQDFSSLVGQDPIKTALQNALEERRIAQAYLFSGIRGVGKTTAARLFAKALNCEKGPAREPCNDCSTCHDITAGSDLDVIEVDAATYSKVEQIRDLTESLRYGPARDRFKVVVIDEIHRLSRQAFDALLKIVEEPPSHLTFIFATTESESVPATILSRCQEYRFRRVSAQVLSSYLRTIADSEEIEVGERALRLIARAGEGSVRDSVALLDQLATFGGGTIGDGDAVRLLGGLDSALFERLLGAILEGLPREVSLIVREIEDNGWDPKSAYSQFLAYCRDALHLALGAEPAQIDLPPDDIESLGTLSTQAGYENLLRLLNQLLSSEQVLRRSESSSLALEIAWLRAAELPKLQRLEELLGAGPPGSPGGGKTSKTSDTTDSGSDNPEASPPISSAPTDERQAGDSPPSVEPFLDCVRQKRASLRAHLDQARLSYADGTLTIEAGSDDLLRDAIERNRGLLDDSVRLVWGPEATWRVIAGSVPSTTTPPQAASEPPSFSREMTVDAATSSNGSRPRSAGSTAPRERRSRSGTIPPTAAKRAHTDRNTPNAQQLAEVSKDPTVQTVLEVFGGSIVSVEPRMEPEVDSAEPSTPKQPRTETPPPESHSPQTDD